jgi:hypothetical protein
VLGIPGRPNSLHKYNYAEGDPVGNADPSGMLLDLSSTFIASNEQLKLRTVQQTTQVQPLLSAKVVAMAATGTIGAYLTATEVDTLRRSRNTNTMRLQLQKQDFIHYWSMTVVQVDPNSVEKVHVYAMLKALALACELGECIDSSVKGNPKLPSRLMPALGSAIVKMSRWVKFAPGPVTGGIETIHQEYVVDPREKTLGDRPRIDLEQVNGTNFRRPF